MKQQKWLMGVVAAGMALGSIVPGYSDTAKPAPKPARPKPVPGARDMAQIEAVNGQPLTDDQKNQISQAALAHDEAIRVANDTYAEALAKAIGMTVADWNTKKMAWQKEQREQMAKKAAAAAATTAPAATTPATTTPAAAAATTTTPAAK